MFFPEGGVRVFLYGAPADMRKSYDGLSALTKHALGEDPLSGNLFVFINRRRNQIKVLYFDRSGYCVWSKRLERGRFEAAADGIKQPLNLTQLQLILEGIEFKNILQNKRFSLDETRA
ncbi:MAG: IS66 family insertion sequence element accessory protein TnpB [Gammaproteobacteria bacterium]|nr:IS66 family insertion sequence element accessory protein TnpB [Gammaproteobacteria bacterium]